MSCGYHTDQTDSDINSQVTDQSTLETTNETAASPLLPLLPAQRQQYQRGRASLVVCSAARQKHRCGRRCVMYYDLFKNIAVIHMLCTAMAVRNTVVVFLLVMLCGT